ncbi:hypothetical protein NMG60_11012144, partial [Bertholletia excelsa]
FADMISEMLNSTNPAYYEFSEQQLARIDPTRYPDLFDETIYTSDEFRMYGFKIKRCPRLRSHDWTQCPFAHRGEKARRRDPRRYNYAAVACPDYRNGGECRRGDTCQYAHGVFEYWLHPSKYRTRPCNSGEMCRRRVCFFAHSWEELRDDPKLKQHQLFCLPSDTMAKGSSVDCGATSSAMPVAQSGKVTGEVDGGSDFLARLSGLTIREGGQMARGLFGMGLGPGAVPESCDPDVDWVTDLVE